MNKMNIDEKIYRLKNYWYATLKNKLCAIILFGLGVFSAKISNEATFLVFVSLFVIPLFFSRRNWIV